MIVHADSSPCRPTAPPSTPDTRVRVDDLREVLPSVYRKLRRTAAFVLRTEAAGFTLGATDLVHEAVLRVARDGKRGWNDRRHLLRSLGIAMQRALADHARRRLAARRQATRVTALPAWIAERVAGPSIDDQVLRLDEALADLQAVSPEVFEAIQLRFFSGLSPYRIARTMGIPRRAAMTALRTGRAYLAAAIAAES